MGGLDEVATLKNLAVGERSLLTALRRRSTHVMCDQSHQCGLPDCESECERLTDK